MIQDISPSNLMVRVGEYHVLNRNEAHPHLDRRIRDTPAASVYQLNS